jgi:N-acetylglucosaminyl-diphospho-decaprenol L-rhamnosyltransferase
MTEPRAAPDVSVLIVSYNTCDMTVAAIASVMAQTQARAFEIIVVDNASTDGSATALAVIPGIRFAALPQNVGFGRANAIAARFARGRYLLLLNPDTVVIDRAIDRLVAFAESNPGPRIWGGRTLFADGAPNPGSCWAAMTPWRLFCRASGLAALFPRVTALSGEAMGGFARDEARAVDIVSGCFLLIARTDWDRLGGFDPAYFMYGEDADLCLRARKTLGARPMITPAATIVHHGGASEPVRADKLVRLLSAKATLIRAHFAPGSVALGLKLLAAWPLSRLVASRALAMLAPGGRWSKTAAAWTAVWQRRDEWLGPAPRPAPGDTQLAAEVLEL